MIFKDVYTYQGIYTFMFWLTLVIYLLPLFIILVPFFVFKGSITSNNKKTIIIDNKKYKVVGNKVFDYKNHQIGIMKDDEFIREKR